MTRTDCLPSDAKVCARRTPRAPSLLSGALLAAGTAFAVAAFGIAFSLAIMSGDPGGAATTLLGIAAWLLLSIGSGYAMALRTTTRPD